MLVELLFGLEDVANLITVLEHQIDQVIELVVDGLTLLFFQNEARIHIFLNAEIFPLGYQLDHILDGVDLFEHLHDDADRLSIREMILVDGCSCL